MKTKLAYTISTLIIISTAWAMTSRINSDFSNSEPTYASKETKEVIEKMIEAHGGLSPWKSKPSISYRHTYVGPHDPSDPWTSDEIVEQGRRRVVQNWPLDDAKIIYDGNGYYGVNWKRGNPPKFTAHLAMYFANIPWLTQDDGVKLGEIRRRRVLDDSKEYITIKMTFVSSAGEAPKDYYDLFIDPDTYLLQGFEYIMTYGALLDLMELPAEMDFMGPFVKKIESYTTVEGLIVPSKMITLGSKGEDYGYHIYKNWSFSKAFNDELVKIPDNAIEDHSSSERKK